MKKISFIILSFIILAGAAQAQDRRNSDSISLVNGRSVVRINIGDDRDDRDMLKRIHRLEQAVSALQEQVYQLKSAPTVQEIKVCSGLFFSAGQIIAKASSEIEARALVISKCQKKTSPIFCEENKIRCESTFE